jgi:hypothetical protein
MRVQRGRGPRVSALALGLCMLIGGCAAPRPIEQAHTAVVLPTETLPLGYTPLPFQLARPTDPPTRTAPTAPPPMPASVDQRSQYERWIVEARAAHPYPETAEHMLHVMICESSGNAATIAGPYHGLFQYLPSTWAGDWNPYRDQPILDARAQIFATAKAWQEGYQSWWGCYQAPS